MKEFREVYMPVGDLTAIRRFATIHREIREASESEKGKLPATPPNIHRTYREDEQSTRNERLTITKPNIQKTYREDAQSTRDERLPITPPNINRDSFPDEVLSLDEERGKRL